MGEGRMRGVIAAVPTPFDERGEPHADLFVAHAQWALDNGCNGLNVLGTTGEANSLSAAQRKDVMRVAATALPAGRLMVGTGTPDLPTTAELTRFAFEAGFAAALVLPPYYYKPVTDDGLFAWFAAIVHLTAETPAPIYLYNFPQLTGIALSVDCAARLAKAFPDRIAGMKDSSGDLDYAAQMASIDGFEVFPSNEVALARAQTDGFAGCISATVNINAPRAADLWASPNDADALRSLSESRSHIASFPLVPAIKYLVAERLEQPAFAAVLPPLLPLNAEQRGKLRS